jgi:hypothetical protein
MQNVNEDEAKNEARWMERMYPVAIDIARWFTRDSMFAQDLVAEAVAHLLCVQRRRPGLNLMENENYTRRVLQNKMRDVGRAERRRTTPLDRLSEEASEYDKECDRHSANAPIDPVFDDAQMSEFEDREWLVRVYHDLRPHLTNTPRRLLDAIYRLDTWDPETLAQATGIRNADAVRTNLSILRRTAKRLKI